MKALTIIFLLVATLFSKSDIKTYQASFLQTITNPSGKVINYKGLLYIKQPNKMLWKYKNTY